jgi:hypothetical protein
MEGNLSSSQIIIRVIESRIMRLARQIAGMEREKVRTGFWWRDLKEGDHLEDLDIDARIILR